MSKRLLNVNLSVYQLTVLGTFQGTAITVTYRYTHGHGERTEMTAKQDESEVKRVEACSV